MTIRSRTCCVPGCATRIRDDSPIPTCTECGWQIAQQFESRIYAKRREDYNTWRARTEAARRERDGDRLAGLVYYVRIGEHIKIGTTTKIKSRMTALRVNNEDILAVEPGGRELEAQRHREFRAERISRREDFSPSDRLMAHIEATRQEHGLPSWVMRPSRTVRVTRRESA